MKLLLHALGSCTRRRQPRVESLPPWISVPESDAKGRNSTAVSNARLTPTMGFCQQKGRGKGETTTISICLGPECLLKQHKIRFAQGHADRSRQAEPRSSSRLLARRRPGTTAQAGRCELATLPSPDWLCPPSLPSYTTPNTCVCPLARPLTAWERHRQHLSHASRDTHHPKQPSSEGKRVQGTEIVPRTTLSL